MRTRVVLSAVALAFSGFAAPVGQAAPAVDAGVGTMAVTFAEEFNGPAGTRPDASKWNTEVGDNNGNNREHQYYTTSASNAAMDGAGNLVITARKENPGNYNCWYGRCQYTSARINTAGKFTTTYGKVEARMKMPRGKGIWPAFWMLGQDINSGNPWPGSGEIDIMEFLGHDLDTVYGTIHGPGYSGAGGIGMAHNGPNFADGFHTFAIEWSPTGIAWSVDGNVYQRRTPADVGGNQWVFNKPFFIILNLAVGGEWPGYPDATTTFPQQFVIDYVRVSTLDSTPPAGGRITGVGGKCVDVAGANPANGTPVQLWDCNGTAAQQWSRPGDGTIRALGKCLDAASGGTADGTLVQLWDCNGTGAQKWAVSGANDIVNIQANKCLDAQNSSSANGTRLQLWTCFGTANQKWTVA
ncbi:glycoside hydrolase family 16 protein [Saccharothrix luteola]|uniref:glycoside hydrolase family 16 protein n=1 Tax=Saccharothrix luteola TaxID=2893018 RepID=UPI001E449B0F|nr:glycoside hydrolase family 16 protein [Saccharothrix luteola]MCC8251342.1 family 16 glycosylhydrolase [Saccharothrix luteola]